MVSTRADFFVSRYWRLSLAAVLSAALLLISSSPASSLAVPVLLQPANFSLTTVVEFPPQAIPAFAWQAVPGATLYRLQVDDEPGFLDPVPLDILTQSTQYTPLSNAAQLLADGVWYWRVRVELPGPPGGYSETWQYTKDWASPGNKPALIAPADGVLIAFFDAPAFSWEFVTGASRYRFQVSNSPDGFADPLYSVDTTSPRHQPSARFPNGDYYWRVLPLNPAGQPGTPSEVRLFSLAYGTTPLGLVPMLLAPENNSGQVFTPTFRWSAVAGAQYYQLQFTSAPSCDFSSATQLDIFATSYTHPAPFSNNVIYCWRVRVLSGASIGDWSDTWQFHRLWNISPRLLTPANLYSTGLYPLYSWTPIPGAAYYFIELDTDPGFSGSGYQVDTVTNPFYTPRVYNASAHYWWRVTPYDAAAQPGLTSPVHQFQSDYRDRAPILIYPLYYYPPNDPDIFGTITTNPYEDRTVAFPVFIWHRLHNPPPSGGIYPFAYRIQVDTDPNFLTPVWELDTENTQVTPTSSHPFLPQVGQDYYWRVCPLNQLGDPACLVNPATGDEWWSQVWVTRFDSALQSPPTPGNVPVLLRPANAQESVESTPLFEWLPLQGASLYQIQISDSQLFSTTLFSDTTTIPAYVPPVSFAQRKLDRLDFGTFFWRVSGFVDGDWSPWSAAWHFQIASQSEWRRTRTLGSPANRLQVGSDSVGDAASNYDLSLLSASQSNLNWYFGFDHTQEMQDVTYGFYLDVDSMDGSGALSPPAGRDYQVNTLPAHQPEYAIYIDQISGTVSAHDTWLYAWDGSWSAGTRLDQLPGGSLINDNGFIEIQVPAAYLSLVQTYGSLSIELFSVDITNGTLQDSVPSDGNIPGSGMLSRFTTVSDHLNLLIPPNIASSDTSTLSSLLPFYWDWPVGGDPSGYGPVKSNPFAGSQLQIATDPAYANIVETVTIASSTAYLGQNQTAVLGELVDGDTYYWRVRPRYLSDGEYYGAFTGGWSFQHLGFIPQNLQVSQPYSSPVFSWDIAEGATGYDLQVATDPGFNQLVLDVHTTQSTYTQSLAQDDYYWRVRIHRYPGIPQGWSTVQAFTLRLPSPWGLTPDDPAQSDPVSHTPTLCWAPLVIDLAGEPVFSAYAYHIQLSTQPDFSIILDEADSESHCWTPRLSYPDGVAYWRVAMLDGSLQRGPYSPAAQYIQLSPLSTLLSPVGGLVLSTPTFLWTVVPGASSYRLEVSYQPDFSPLLESVETYNITYTPTVAYPHSGMLYWRIAARDAQGWLGPYASAEFRLGYYSVNLPLVSK